VLLLAGGCSCGPREGVDGGIDAGLDGGADAGIDDGGGDGGARIIVPSGTSTNCRTESCPHQSDTDLARFGSAAWLVHRTALSDLPSVNASLRVYRSEDGGTFALTAVLPGPSSRDIRAPHFFVVQNTLNIAAISRLEVSDLRNAGADSTTIVARSTDGVTWSPFTAAAPQGWSLWRPHLAPDGGLVAVATSDGDQAVQWFASADGSTFTAGAAFPLDGGDTPAETDALMSETGDALTVTPLEGTDAELEGDTGRLRTAVCNSPAPLTVFACDVLAGERLDTPLVFAWQNRTLVLARHHTLGSSVKRTALFELGDGGIALLQTLPSAGDTGAPGLLITGSGPPWVSWYASPLSTDAGWSAARTGQTDIWLAPLSL
jgi:hypothetical protein